MFKRVDFTKIIRDHFNTLKRIDSSGRGASFPDLILFVFMPVFISTLLTLNRVSISPHVTALITSISIIGGFLFNLLAIIYGLMDKLVADSKTDELKSIFVKQVHINISFNILISLFLLLFLIIYSFIDAACGFGVYWIADFLTLIIYFLLMMFLLTMLMILNRIYILLKKS